MGAWIETKAARAQLQAVRVAPYVGAWIETILIQIFMIVSLSHPTWVRGLKLS